MRRPRSRRGIGVAALLIDGLEQVPRVITAAEATREAFKVWRSQADSRVRTIETGPFDHLVPDGQRVPSHLPFTVSGEALMWPGDTSLGASLGNVIRCRCGAVYDVVSVAAARRSMLGLAA